MSAFILHLPKLEPIGGRLSPPAKSRALARDLEPVPGRLQ